MPSSSFRPPDVTPVIVANRAELLDRVEVMTSAELEAYALEALGLSALFVEALERRFPRAFADWNDLVTKAVTTAPGD